jgi:hypothetical protein
MTSISQQNFYQFEHPEDALEAYALGALDEDEYLNLEYHLQDCFHCSRTLAGLEQAALALAQAASQQTPPPLLQTRLMQAVEDLPPIFAPPTANQEALPLDQEASHRFNFSSFALPLAATLVIGLLSASLIMNLLTTNRLNELERDDLTADSRINQLEQGYQAANAGLEQLAASDAQTGVALKHVMDTNYLMAQPSTLPLQLRPTNGASKSEGLLLVTHDGRKAILMLSNMEPPSPARSYQVWLSRDGQSVPMGPINVDSAGWGSMALNPPESLYGFDWVNLTVDEPTAEGTLGSEMILQTRIVSPPGR